MPSDAHVQRRLRQVSRWERREWGVLFEALVMLPVMSVAVRLVQLPVLARWATTPRSTEILRADQIGTAARQVAFVGRGLGFQCLVRSLTLSRVLARRGVGTDIHLAVQPEGGTLYAHAWVERDGHPLDAPGTFHRQFVPINQVGDSASHV